MSPLLTMLIELLSANVVVLAQMPTAPNAAVAMSPLLLMVMELNGANRIGEYGAGAIPVAAKSPELVS